MNTWFKKKCKLHVTILIVYTPKHISVGLPRPQSTIHLCSEARQSTNHTNVTQSIHYSTNTESHFIIFTCIMQECKCVWTHWSYTHILGPPYASLRVPSDSSDPQIQTSQPEHSGIELSQAVFRTEAYFLLCSAHCILPQILNSMWIRK